jgi:predicted GIY-YIG superfamily endonuclease
MKGGIYQILIDDYYYIGRAKNFENRWKEHHKDKKV